RYISPRQWHALFANGIIISNINHRRFTQSFPLPPPGVTETHSFGSAVDLNYSTDNGQTFQQLTGNANCTVAVTATGTLNGEQLFSTEMLQLDLSGGTLPPQLRIRESPTRHSYGE